MSNGLENKKRFYLHFDISEERYEQLLFNIEEQDKSIEKLKTKISISYHIPKDEILITNP